MDVLVVDDDTAFAKVVSHALTKEGHRVVLATQAMQALQLARQSPPDLLIIDLMMPGINGLQLLLALKSDSATSGIPAIVWTATVTDDLARQALAFGADAMLIKTRFSMGELRRLVKHLLADGTHGEETPAIRRLLLVEDDDDTREAVVMHLRGAGYLVHEAENGWEALMMLDREKFDLVVLDMVMPGMDGPTFLRILRNGQKHHHIPVLVLTAHDLHEMKNLVDSLGVSGVMGKKAPMWDDLVPAVQRVLETV